MSTLRFDNKVVVVTGAGNGLGKEYALFFGSRGAKVVVNDLGSSHTGTGASAQAADKVVDEIKAKGGQAVANYDSVEFGDKIVKTAIDAFGRIDILINNAGILRDVSFKKMTEQDWELIYKVHLKGTYACTKAAWKYFNEQKSGKVINTSSASGLYGSFGQANYSAAKMGVHGLTTTLSREGAKRNIQVNTICPVAASRLTETVMPKDILGMLNPSQVVPLVAYLCHESATETGSLFELGAGYISKIRWQRNQGYFFDNPYTPEDVRDKWQQVSEFTDNVSYPTSPQDAFGIFFNRDDIIAEQKNPANKLKQQASAASANNIVLKSEQIFALMKAFLAQGEGKDLVNKIKAIYNFDINEKKGGPVLKSWVIDLYTGQGSVREGTDNKADATFLMSDDDFEKVCLGTLQPQQAFMRGQMKIKGNMKKANLFTPELFPPPTPENIAKYNQKPKL